MADTDTLLKELVKDSAPVRRLPSPPERAIAWLLISIPFMALVVAMMGLRADLPQKLSETRYIIEQIAALLTAVTAAFAAFSAVLPSAPRWSLFLPVAPLVIWLGSLGFGCFQDFLMPGQTGDAFKIDLHCLPAIALVGSLPAFVMAIMIRRGAPLYPRIAVALGALAAAAIGDVGLRFFHGKDASLMVLVWQFGSVALLAALAGCCGKRLHHWRHVPA